MSVFGDDVSEMDQFKKLSDRDIEALLAGQAPDSGEDLDGVAGFVRTAKATVPEALDPAVEQRHLAAIVDAAQLMEPGNARLEGPIRRKSMLSSLFAPLWVKVAAAVVTGVLATSGLAAAHVLPGPLQDAVESVVGIDTSEDEADAAEEAAEAAEEAAEADEEAAEEAADADDDAESDDDSEGDDDADDDSDEADDDSDEADDDSDEADDDSDEADESDDDAESDDESDEESEDDSDEESDDDSDDDDEDDEESD